MARVRSAARQALADSEPRIAAGGSLSDEDRQQLIAAARQAMADMGEQRDR